jgi:hypothetical protein
MPHRGIPICPLLGAPGIPQRALWSRNEPVSVLGAQSAAHGQQEIDGPPRTCTLRATQVYRRESG